MCSLIPSKIPVFVQMSQFAKALEFVILLSMKQIYSDLEEGPRAPLGVPVWKSFWNRRDTSLR